MGTAKKRISCWIALGFSAVVLTTCGRQPNMRGLQNLSADYEQRLTDWTAAGQKYHSLDRVLFAYATFLSRPFRDAYVSQYRELFSLDPAKRDDELEKIYRANGEGYAFFVFVDAPHYSWNNIDEPNAVFRMVLKSDKDLTGVPPARVVGFHTLGPNLKAFFPYINDFGRAFLVTFPATRPDHSALIESRSPLILAFASAYGTVTMSWRTSE